MTSGPAPLAALRARILAGEITPKQLAKEALQKSNQNAGHNVYLARDEQWTLAEADRVERQFAAPEKPPLYGIPVSLKDCFDLEGFKTTAGTRFYANKNPAAAAHSAVAQRLREQGAIITGKTHLHPLAYGITGENPDYGDSQQPANPDLLTGGSTSGGAASVQEGSALAAIGTDTGGSIRVPAALCNLAGYRATIGLGWERDLWQGSIALAPSFDTLGWIFQDSRDGPLLGEALFGLQVPKKADMKVRIGAITLEFLRACDATVLSAFEEFKQLLASTGARLEPFSADDWEEAFGTYAPIQASEAAAIHEAATGGDYSCFPSPLGERLTRGAQLTVEDVGRQRLRHAAFRQHVDFLLGQFDFLMLPCAPVNRLEAGKDHTHTRAKILRYTTPLSLAGTPVVTVPTRDGTGMQLAAARGEDARLLAYAAALESSRLNT